MDYDIYYGLNRYNKKKTYLVFSNPNLKMSEMQRQANKFFKRPTRNVIIDVGYVLNDELYFEAPEDYHAQVVAVAYFI